LHPAAGYYVNDDWGLSFMVPGILIAAGGILVFLFMIVRPEDVGIDLECTENAAGDAPGVVSYLPPPTHTPN
jgi:OPA family glycerol-3-phosphate transporter-like MFS transporter 1/2